MIIMSYFYPRNKTSKLEILKKVFAADNEQLPLTKIILGSVWSISISDRRMYKKITDVFAENVNKFFNFNEYIVLEDLVNKL